MLEPSIMLLVALTFLIAGTVKGVIGLGLPSVSLALLTVTLDLPTAMALLLVPSFVTNLWQASAGGNARVILVRLWPFFLMATVTVWIGVLVLTRVNLSLLTVLLGLLLVSYSVVNLGGIKLVIPARHEAWVGPLSGLTNGVLTGMTGSFVVPGVIYLQAIGLSRDALIQAMGILFTVSTLALGLAMQQSNILTAEQTILSVGAVVPAIIGMALGQLVRGRLPEQQFRMVFFVALLLLGSYIVFSAL